MNKARARVVVTKDGPYLVSGDVPLAKQNADKEKRRPPKGGAGGKCGDATRKTRRRARKHDDAFADRKNQKATGHNVISPPKVFYGEQWCGHHKSGAVDRP